MACFVTPGVGASPRQMLDLARAVNAALRGDSANTGTLAVAEGATSAEVLDPRCRAGRLALLIPLDAAAASVRWHLSSMGRGRMAFAFDSAPGACRFGWVLMGLEGDGRDDGGSAAGEEAADVAEA